MAERREGRPGPKFECSITACETTRNPKSGSYYCTLTFSYEVIHPGRPKGRRDIFPESKSTFVWVPDPSAQETKLTHVTKSNSIEHGQVVGILRDRAKVEIYKAFLKDDAENAVIAVRKVSMSLATGKATAEVRVKTEEWDITMELFQDSPDQPIKAKDKVEMNPFLFARIQKEVAKIIAGDHS